MRESPGSPRLGSYVGGACDFRRCVYVTVIATGDYGPALTGSTSECRCDIGDLVCAASGDSKGADRDALYYTVLKPPFRRNLLWCCQASSVQETVFATFSPGMR